ncbi:MAG: 50S ribosomal protein L29 [Nanoarchaeota archaeon]|mgnify:CR=1 FL=1
MAVLKIKDIKNMSKEDIEKKLKELKFELIKSKANAAKSGKSNKREIKKIIARILTLNKSSPLNMETSERKTTK